VAGEVEPFLLATRSGIRGNLSVNYIAFGIIAPFTCALAFMKTVLSTGL
jgi:hypothetical protein